MAPVLDDGIDLAGLEAFPADLLGQVLVLDLEAELVLEQIADDAGIGFVADPRVDRDVDVSPRWSAAATAAAAGGD